jgi:hypothetical protein
MIMRTGYLVVENGLKKMSLDHVKYRLRPTILLDDDAACQRIFVFICDAHEVNPARQFTFLKYQGLTRESHRPYFPSK